MSGKHTLLMPCKRVEQGTDCFVAEANGAILFQVQRRTGKLSYRSVEDCRRDLDDILTAAAERDRLRLEVKAYRYALKHLHDELWASRLIAGKLNIKKDFSLMNADAYANKLANDASFAASEGGKI